MENYDINLSGLKNTKNASGILQGCSSAKSVDASQLNMNAYADNMFNGASSLTDVNLGSTQPTSATNMFAGTPEGKTLQVNTESTKSWIEANKATMGLADGSYTINKVPVSPGDELFLKYSNLDIDIPLLEPGTYNLTVDCTGIAADQFKGNWDASPFGNKLKAAKEGVFFNLKPINIDSSITDVSFIFDGCSGLTSIDTSAFTQVIYASSMFSGCSGLTSIDTATFTKVINASNMFSGCSGLTSIDTKAFTQVTDVSYMFSECTGLTSIDTSAFTQVTTASYMFYNCTGLTSIDTSVFTQVTDASGMFRYCSGLTSIRYGSMVPSNFNDMFSSVPEGLTISTSTYQAQEFLTTNRDAIRLVNPKFEELYIDLDTYVPSLEAGTYDLTVDCTGVGADQFIGSYDSSPFGNKLQTAKSGVFFNLKPINIDPSITDTSYMFSGCSGLTSIDTKAFTQVTNASWMFSSCSGLTSINTSAFTQVTNAWGMFYNCTGLTSIDTSAFTQVTDVGYMFSECTGLTSIDTSAFTKVTNAEGMFYRCTGLTSITGTEAFTQVTNASWMFSSCSGLTSIDTKAFTNVITAYSMFSGCSGLTSIDTSAFTQVTDVSYMFSECTGLTSIDTSAFTQVTTASSIFSSCSGLTDITWGTIKPATNTDMFSGASAAKTITVDDYETKKWIDTNASNMMLESYTLRANPDTVTIIPENIPYKDFDFFIPLYKPGTYNQIIDCTGVTADQFVGTDDDCSPFGNILVSANNNVYFNLNFRLPDNTTSIYSCFNSSKKEIPLKSVNIQNTVSLVNFSNAFKNCKRLETLLVEEVPSVEAADSCFENCYNLRSTSLLSFNNLTSGNNIFKNCRSLESSIILQGDFTGSMTSAFEGCKSLYSFENIEIFKNVVDLSHAFSNCTNLSKIDLSSLANTTKVSSLLEGDTSLTEIYWGNVQFNDAVNILKNTPQTKFITVDDEATKTYVDGLDIEEYKIIISKNKYNIKYSELTALIPTLEAGTYDLIVDCTGETDISQFGNILSTASTDVYFNLSPIGISQSIIDAHQMFIGCNSLKSIKYESFANITNASQMFEGCTNLISISCQKPTLLDNAEAMFENCLSLSEINIINFQKATNTSFMFSGCKSLKSLDISCLKNSKKANNMLQDCLSLNDITWGSIKPLENIDMFSNSLLAKTIKIDDYETKKWVEANAENMKLANYTINNIAIAYSSLASEIPTLVAGTYDLIIDCKDTDVAQFIGTEASQYHSPFRDILSSAAEDVFFNLSFINIPDTLTDISFMLKDCINIKSIDLKEFKNVKVTANTFENCTNLININWYILSPETFENMFLGATAQKEVHTLTYSKKEWIEANAETLKLNTFEVTSKYNKPIPEDSFIIEYEDVEHIVPELLAGTYKFIVNAVDAPENEFIGNELEMLPSIFAKKFANAKPNVFFNIEVELPNLITDISNCFNSKNIKIPIYKITLKNTFSLRHASKAFYECTNLKKVSFENARNLVDLSYLCYNCEALSIFELSNISKVYDTRYMLFNCRSLKNISVKGFENTLDASYMFYDCRLLSNIENLEGLKYIETANSMLYNCKSLKEIKIPDFNNIKKANHLFKGCSLLTKFTLSEVVPLEYTEAFNCNTLHKIFSVPNFTVAKWLNTTTADTLLTDYEVFYKMRFDQLDRSIPTFNEANNYEIIVDCKDVNDIELRKFGQKLSSNTTEGVTFGLTPINIKDGFTDATNMFRKCLGLTSIDTKAFTQVTTARNMFQDCSGLTSIDTSAFTQVTNASGMFVRCSGLTSIDTRAFTNVRDASLMFSGCSGLTSIDTMAFSQVTIAGYMFQDCSGLTSITGTEAFTQVTDACDMFWGCTGLTSIDTKAFTKVTNAAQMFRDCTGLTKIDTSAFTQVINTSDMFQGCTGLTDITWGSIKPATNTNMFSGASATKVIKVKFNDLKNWIDTNAEAMKLTSYTVEVTLPQPGEEVTIRYNDIETEITELLNGNFKVIIDTTSIAKENFKGDIIQNSPSDFYNKLLFIPESTTIDKLSFDLPNEVEDTTACFDPFNEKVLPITSIDITKSENLKTASSMFKGLSGLQTVNINSAVLLNEASHMFENCTSLTDIIGLENTSITEGQWLFANCDKLNNLNTKGLSHLINATSAFENCSALTKIDTTNFNKIENAEAMFKGCENLVSIDISPFISLKNATQLLANNKNLLYISWGGITPENTTDILKDTKFISTIKVAGTPAKDFVMNLGFDDQKVVIEAPSPLPYNYIRYWTPYFDEGTYVLNIDAKDQPLDIFHGDIVKGTSSELSTVLIQNIKPKTYINLSMDLPNEFINADLMFKDCSSLLSVDLKDSFETIQYANGMFEGCSNLDIINTDFMSSILQASHMFMGCTSLDNIYSASFMNIENGEAMFKDCTELKHINSDSFRSIKNATSMFENCSKLTSISLENFESLENSMSMFNGCTLLAKVDGLNKTSVFDNMFTGCTSQKEILVKDNSVKSWVTTNETTLGLENYSLGYITPEPNTEININYEDIEMILPKLSNGEYTLNISTDGIQSEEFLGTESTASNFAKKFENIASDIILNIKVALPEGTTDITGCFNSSTKNIPIASVELNNLSQVADAKYLLYKNTTIKKFNISQALNITNTSHAFEGSAIIEIDLGNIKPATLDGTFANTPANKLLVVDTIENKEWVETNKVALGLEDNTYSYKIKRDTDIPSTIAYEELPTYLPLFKENGEYDITITNIPEEGFVVVENLQNTLSKRLSQIPASANLYLYVSLPEDCTDITKFFTGIPSLVEATIVNRGPSAIIADSAFENCTKLKNAELIYANISSANKMFKNTAISEFNFEKYSSLKNTVEMLSNCNNLEKVVFAKDLASFEDASNMFTGSTKEKTLSFIDGIAFDWVSKNTKKLGLENFKYNIHTSQIPKEIEYKDFGAYIPSFMPGTYKIKIDNIIPEAFRSEFNNTLKSSQKGVMYSLTLDIPQEVESLSESFIDNDKLLKMAISGAESVLSTSSMYKNCRRLEKFEVVSEPMVLKAAVGSSLGNVQNASSMFENCSRLQSTDLSPFASVTNTSYMYKNCESLNTVNLGSFNTTTNTYNEMFLNDTTAKKLKVNDASQIGWIADNKATLGLENYTYDIKGFDSNIGEIEYVYLDEWMKTFEAGYYTFKLLNTPEEALASELNNTLKKAVDGVLIDLEVDIPQEATSLQSCFKDNKVLYGLKLNNISNILNISDMLNGAVNIHKPFSIKAANSLVAVENAFANTSIDNFEIGNFYNTCQSFDNMFLNNTSQKLLNCFDAEQVRWLNTNKETLALTSHSFELADELIPLKYGYSEVELWAPIYHIGSYSASILGVPTDACQATIDQPSKISNIYKNLTKEGAEFNLSLAIHGGITDISYMFKDNYKLSGISISTTNTIKNAIQTFKNCEKLSKVMLLVDSFENTESMFEYCGSLKTIDSACFRNAKICNSMFKACSNLIEIDGTNFTSVTEVNQMFEYCQELKAIDVSTFTNITNAFETFRGCSSLTEMNISSFDNVQNANSLFANCINLKKITFRDFYKNVTSFTDTFAVFGAQEVIFIINDLNARKWISENSVTLGISNFAFGILYNDLDNYIESITEPGDYDMFIDKVPTESLIGSKDTKSEINTKLKVNPDIYYTVTFELPKNSNSLEYAFVGNTALKAIKIENFERLTNISHTFENCSNLEKYNLEAFANTIDTSGTFIGNTLTTIDMSYFANSQNTSNMFENTPLESIDITPLTSITQAKGMFKNCTNLANITGEENFSHTLDIDELFYNCGLLTKINTQSFRNAISTNSTFENCVGLTSIDLAPFTQLLSANNMFKGCNKLTSAVNLAAYKLTSANSLFENCNKLSELSELKSLTSLQYANSMLKNCTSLLKIDATSLSKVEDARSMFENCTGITSIDISAMSEAKQTDLMLSGCTRLNSVFFGNMQVNNESHLGMFRDAPVTKVTSSATAKKWLKANANTLELNISNVDILSLKAVYTFSRVDDNYTSSTSNDDRLIKGDLTVMGTIRGKVIGEIEGIAENSKLLEGKSAKYFATKDSVDGLTSGTTKAGNAEKLDDHDSTYFATKTSVDNILDGTSVVKTANEATLLSGHNANYFTIPIGTIIAYAGKTIPEDYLLCDGSTFSEAYFPKLKALLGTNTTPNLKNRFLEGTPSLSSTRSIKNAGLPNIKDYALYSGKGYPGRGVESNGVFYSTNGNSSQPSMAAGSWEAYGTDAIGFDASRGGKDPIYGKSSTVQPASYLVAYIIRAK